MARTTTPPTSPSPEEIGTFVSTTPIGFVTPTDTEVRAILRAARAPTLTDGGAFYRDLLVLKQLAPEQTRNLLVYPAPMVLRFVNQLRDRLVMQYYLSGGAQP